MPLFKCDQPDCEKYFSSKAKLKQHKKRVHGIADDSPLARGQDKSQPADDGLVITPPAAKPKPPPDDDEQPFHCQDCGADITPDMETCPGCGEPLIWDGLV